MRIALISTCAVATPPTAYGGTELIVAELASGLRERDHDVTVFATGDSRPGVALCSHFAQPVWPPNDLAELRHGSSAWSTVAHAVRPYDLVHIHHPVALPFHLLLDVPTVLTVHHHRTEELVAHYRTYQDVGFVGISHRQVELSPELSFARVIHHGLDPSVYEAGAGDGGYVAFLGRFSPEKAPHVAIDAARRAGVPICLGGAPHEVALGYFEREIRPRLDNPSVDWRGELTPGPKVALLQRARALLMPIDWEEPFGLVMIEAMLVGTPVIAYARGSAPELIEEGVTGYVVRDETEMVERIGQIDRISRVGCRARAQQRFSTARMAAEYVALYEGMLSRRAARRIAAAGLRTDPNVFAGAWPSVGGSARLWSVRVGHRLAKENGHGIDRDGAE